MPQPILLTEADVSELLTPQLTVAAIEGMFEHMAAGMIQNVPRRRASLPGMTLHSLSATDGSLGRAGWKQYTTTRSSARFLVGLYEQRSGELLALIEADRLGRLRTGAVSAVAARILLTGKPTDQLESLGTVAIIGSGRQAETQVACLDALGRVARFRVGSRTLEHSQDFVHRMAAQVSAPIEAATSIEDCVRGAEVVVTITSAKEPVIDAAWLDSCRLVIAAGSNQPKHREVPTPVVVNAQRIVVDDIEGAPHEAGDLILAAAESCAAGDLWLRVESLGSVLAGRRTDESLPQPSFERSNALTPSGSPAGTLGTNLSGVACVTPEPAATGSWMLFKSVGMAAADIAAASVVYDQAIALGRGTALPMTLNN